MAFKTKYRELEPLILFLFEYGKLLEDDLSYKFALLSSGSISTEYTKKLMGEISLIINPEAGDINSKLDAKIPALMKELENTIVTFDKDSIRKIRAQIKREKMVL